MATKKSRTRLNQLRTLAGSLPEATEQLTWGHPTFRVRNKIFASFGEHEGRTAITVKQRMARQEALTGDPRFFVPPYVGKHGWVGIFAEEVEWEFVAELVEEAYRLTAPKSLVKLLET